MKEHSFFQVSPSYKSVCKMSQFAVVEAPCKDFIWSMVMLPGKPCQEYHENVSAKGPIDTHRE